MWLGPALKTLVSQTSDTLPNYTWGVRDILHILQPVDALFQIFHFIHLFLLRNQKKNGFSPLTSRFLPRNAHQMHSFIPSSAILSLFILLSPTIFAHPASPATASQIQALAPPIIHTSNATTSSPSSIFPLSLTDLFAIQGATINWAPDATIPLADFRAILRQAQVHMHNQWSYKPFQGFSIADRFPDGNLRCWFSLVEVYRGLPNLYATFVMENVGDQYEQHVRDGMVPEVLWIINIDGGRMRGGGGIKHV